MMQKSHYSRKYLAEPLVFSLTVLTAITVAVLGSQGWAQFNGSKSTPTRSSNTSGSSTYPPGPVWILASEGIQQEVGLSASSGAACKTSSPNCGPPSSRTCSACKNCRAISRPRK